MDYIGITGLQQYLRAFSLDGGFGDRFFLGYFYVWFSMKI